MPEKILIVDDEESILNQLRWGLDGEYEVLTASTMEEARRALREERPGIVTLDVTLGPPSAGPEGLDLLDEIVERHPSTKVIMVTGNDRRENAITALQRGAIDWYAKPIELEELRVILKRAVHIRSIEMAQPGGPVAHKRYHRLVGESESMRKVFGLVRRVASTDVNVLVLGESGTGKELVANAVHEAGPRRDQPFVPINCGAFPESLLESELFGHERGAYTDAHRARDGKLELADHGTLFLDEIGEVPLHLQVKLLRFLQEHVIERIGGRETVHVDARVVAATNRNLKVMMDEGRFREDLYFRLGVIVIMVPALRERGDDLRLLAEYFLEFYGRQYKRRLRGFTQAALRAILAYPWPGNVRELENKVQRAVILAQDAYLRPEDLELESAGGGAEPLPTLQAARDEAERRLLVEALTRKAGNVTRAAREIDVSRPTLHDLVRKHGIDLARFRRPDLPDDNEDEEPGAP
jgi:two-component system, NtrC family, response regulator